MSGPTIIGVRMGGIRRTIVSLLDEDGDQFEYPLRTTNGLINRSHHGIFRSVVYVAFKDAHTYLTE